MRQQQVALEDDALANGAKRFRRRLEELTKDGDAAAGGAARKLLTRILEPTIEALEQVQASTDKRGLGLLLHWLKLVGCDTAAYITIKTLLGRPHVDSNLAKLAPTISRLINDEVRYQKLRRKAKGLFDYRIAHFNTSSYRHKAYSLNQTARYAGVEDEVMSDKDAMMLGIKLINVCVANTGIGEFVLEHKRKWGKIARTKSFHLTDETQKLLNDTNDILQFTRPQALPMVIAPLPWSVELNGGYHFALRGKYGLVRKSTSLRARRADMPFVYEGLNTIQATPWKINKDILRVVLDLRSRCSSLGGLPNAEPDPLPERTDWMVSRLPKEQHTEAQAAELRDWKQAASKIKERNNLRASKLIEWLTAINLAKQFSEFAAIWFPHNLDFRGRTYPICSGLQPQGSDLQRGLLTFADAKSLGPNGAYWLAVHGANSLGEYDGIKFTKQAFEQRVQWIHAHAKDIREAAADPERFDWWSSADEPFQFLAFCIEWSRYLDCTTDEQRMDFRSSLPIGQDGTCNGLQHFAALLRDSAGAEAVNLRPEPVPHDVYDKVHKEVRQALVKEAARGVAEGKWWLDSGYLQRSLFKRPTMTFAYGSKKFGMSRQLQESLAGENHENLEEMCHYLAKQIWLALEKVVVAAFGAMEWLSASANAVVQQTSAVEWIVPLTGFPVRQEYWNINVHRVETTLCGKTVKINTYRAGKKPLAHKHRNGIAPNFIHSLDAAALMMTVVMASTEGVTAFAMVHDCYATHAADVPALASATREAFIALYDGIDVADDLYQQFSLVAEVPPPPPKGTFNVHEIRDSLYFFS